MSKCPWNSVKRNIIIIQTLLNFEVQKMDFSIPIAGNDIFVLTVVCLKNCIKNQSKMGKAVLSCRKCLRGAFLASPQVIKRKQNWAPLYYKENLFFRNSKFMLRPSHLWETLLAKGCLDKAVMAE